MFKRMITTILILPGTVLVLVPAVILRFTTNAETGLTTAGPGDLDFWTGLAAIFLGLILAVSTVRLLLTLGQGTPAPWDPPQKLVVHGPYSHVRNPMITAVLLILIGESLMFQSSAIGLWLLIFFTVNGIYLPLSEEPALEARFGDEYRWYKQNVPRWIPRMSPWDPYTPGGDGQDGEEG